MGYMLAMENNYSTTNPTMSERIIACAIIALVGLFAVGAWFANSETLLGSIIQTGLAWCF